MFTIFGLIGWFLVSDNLAASQTRSSEIASTNRVTYQVEEAQPTDIAITPQHMARLDAILNDLVQHHRSDEIRIGLKAAVSAGQVDLVVNPTTRSSLLVMVTNDHLRQGTFAQITMQEEFLADPKYTRSFREIVLLHEWTHVKQIRERRFRPLQVDLKPDGSCGLIGVNDLRGNFQDEAEAYETGCRYAIIVQTANQVPICRALRDYGIRGMLIAIAEEYCGVTCLMPFCGTLRSYAAVH